MKLTIASGKGGTGKTTLATNLAIVGAEMGRRVAYVDCDVEAPNGHLFLKPQITAKKPVHLLIPQIIEDACDQCGLCAQSCMFSALVWVGVKPIVFPELCHGCGACVMACPRHAIMERQREIGIVETGTSGSVDFVHGKMNVGEAKSPPVIRAVRATTPDLDWQIIDAPPGTSCPVVAAAKDSDFVVLVTEPTPFGLHDLKLAVATMRKLALPFGVAINRSDIGDDRVEAYCKEEAIPLMLRIPDDRRIAEAYARGQMMIEAVPQMRVSLASLWDQVDAHVAAAATQGGSA